jgi:hypothetical protein
MLRRVSCAWSKQALEHLPIVRVPTVQGQVGEAPQTPSARSAVMRVWVVRHHGHGFGAVEVGAQRQHRTCALRSGSRACRCAEAAAGCV